MVTSAGKVGIVGAALTQNVSVSNLRIFSSVNIQYYYRTSVFISYCNTNNYVVINNS